MKVRLTYTNGKSPDADPSIGTWVDINLKIGNFVRFYEDDRFRSEWFHHGLYEWIGGRYSILWDNRNPEVQSSVNARLGAEGGRKYWRYNTKEWSIHFVTIFEAHDSTGSSVSKLNIAEDAVIHNTLIENSKTVRTLNNAGHSTGYVRNNGTLFPNGNLSIFWIPMD